MAAWARSILDRVPTDALVRTAKPCGPGIPVLMPAQRASVIVKAGARKPVPGESAE
jgi:hypothetical protein